MATFAIVVPGVVAFLFGLHRVRSAELETGPESVDGIIAVRPVIDLGTVWSGRPANATFSLHNSTDHEIQIESIKADCGCTVPSISAATVKPGQDLRIPVTYWPPVPQHDEGDPFNRTISVSFSMSSPHVLALRLRGLIAPDGSLLGFPAAVHLGSTLVGSTHRVILHFRGDSTLLGRIPDQLEIEPGERPIVLTGQPPPTSLVKVRQKDVQLAIHISEDLSPGDWDAAIRISPDLASEGMTINIQGTVPQHVTVSPSNVILVVGDADSQIASVELASGDGETITPLSVDTSLPLAWDVKTTSDSKSGTAWTLKLRLTSAARSGTGGFVTVKLSDTRNKPETVEIPVAILGAE
jgi:hypothetical protein